MLINGLHVCVRSRLHVCVPAAVSMIITHVFLPCEVLSISLSASFCSRFDCCHLWVDIKLLAADVNLDMTVWCGALVSIPIPHFQFMPVSLSNVLKASKSTVTAVVSHWSPAFVNVIFGFGVFDWKMRLETLSCAKCFLGSPVAMIELSTCQPIADFFLLTDRSLLGFFWTPLSALSHTRALTLLCLPSCALLLPLLSFPFVFFCSLPCSRFASLPPSPWFLLLAREVRVRACGCKWYRSRFNSICRMLIPSDFAPSGCLRWPFSASSLVTYPPSSPVVLPSACFFFPLFFALLHGLTHTHAHYLNIQTPKEYWGTLRTLKNGWPLLLGNTTSCESKTLARCPFESLGSEEDMVAAAWFAEDIQQFRFCSCPLGSIITP